MTWHEGDEVLVCQPGSVPWRGLFVRSEGGMALVTPPHISDASDRGRTWIVPVGWLRPVPPSLRVRLEQEEWEEEENG